MRDQVANFLIKEATGTRAEAVRNPLQALNPYASISTLNSLDSLSLDGVDVVVVTDIFRNPVKDLKQLNERCRAKGVKFIVAATLGLCSTLFNDFGERFEVTDADGEEAQDFFIKSVEPKDEHTFLVTLIDGSKHNFQDGDTVLLSEMEGLQGGPL